MSSPFTWKSGVRERKGFSCDRDTPENSPCLRGNCSACTQQLRDGFIPQALQEIDPERWGRLTLIYREYSRIPDTGLPNRRFDHMKDVLRRRIKDAGLAGARILGTFDVSRQDIIVNGKKTGHHWTVHVHGAIEIVGNVPTMIDQLHRKFPPTSEIPEPVRIDEFEMPVAVWIVYMLKDPALIRKYIHFKWSPRPKRTARAKKKLSNDGPQRLRQYWRPERWRMSEREAEPMMKLLAAHDIEDRLFLQGYRFPKNTWRLVPISNSNSSHPTLATDTPVTPMGPVRTRSNSLNNEGHGYTSLSSDPVVARFQSYLRIKNLSDRFRKLRK